MMGLDLVDIFISNENGQKKHLGRVTEPKVLSTTFEKSLQKSKRAKVKT